MKPPDLIVKYKGEKFDLRKEVGLWGDTNAEIALLRLIARAILEDEDPHYTINEHKRQHANLTCWLCWLCAYSRWKIK